MSRAKHSDANSDARQRIGPAIRELRQRRNWSLRELARQTALSSSYLSRLERGHSIPSFTVLSNLATVFRVSTNYFTEFQRTAEEMSGDLEQHLSDLGVPESTWHEFGSLSLEARGALLDILRRQNSLRSDADSIRRAFEINILSEGIPTVIPKLQHEVLTNGMSPVDFARNRTQIEEASGARFILSDRLCTLPAADRFDQVQLFRGTFGVDPENPMLLKWWTRAQHSALLRTRQEDWSRAIYPINRLEEYLNTGHWGTHLHFCPNMIRDHIRATIHLLRTTNYEIGLIEADIPIRIIAKDQAGVLVMTPTDDDLISDERPGVAVRFSGPQAIASFRAYFDDLWDSIPTERKDSAAVIAWFESKLEAIEQHN